MRILAIRGANLASLADRFELDLAAEPLASAGLFAITGATGAGKSTLLDAMCAALFDRTPRLEGRSRFEVGRGERGLVGAFDVRSLLRRTAGEGWAEVDFEGRDRRRYRARWSVHRARRDPGGALQNQERRLTCIDDDAVIGAHRSETQQAIDQALGLTFDQFRRSALLAQGDFAAFLRADGSQRAALLERMTGTALYGALSMAAHRRGVEIAGERRGLIAAQAAAVVLDDLARAELEEALAAARARLEAARAHEAALAARGQWRIRMRAAAAALARARADHAAAVAARDAAAGLAAAIAQCDRVAPLREAWTRWRDAGERDRAARAAAVEAATAVVAIRDDDARAQVAWKAARAALTAAVAAQTAGAAELAEARRLDDAIATARAGADDARATAAITADRVAAQDRRTAAIERAIDEAATAAADAARYLAAHAAVAAVSAGWERLQEALGEIERGGAAVVEARGRLDAVAPAIHEADRAGAEAEAGRARAERALQIARQRHEAADAAHRATPPAAAQQLLDDAEQRATRLAALAGLAERAGANSAAWRDAQADAVAARERAAGLERERAIGDATVAAQVATLEEAEATAVRLRRAAGLDAQRAALIDGEACPLCGATEHPWGHEPIVDTLLRDQDARVEALAAQVAAARARIQAIEIEIATARARAVDRTRDAERLGGQRTRDAVAWRTAVGELGELLLAHAPDTDAAVAWVAEARTTADRARADARAARDHASALARDATAAHARVLAAAHELEETHAQLERARARIAALAAARIAAERDRDLAGQALAAALTSARAIVPAVHHGSLADPDAIATLASELAAAVAAWRAEHGRAAEAERSLASQRAALAATTEGARELRRAATEAAVAAARADAALAPLVAARAALLEGAATADRAAALEAAIARADLTAGAAERAATTTAAARAAAEARRVHAGEAAYGAEGAVVAARAAVDAGLAERQLDEDTATHALATPPERLARDRARLAELDRAVVATRAREAELEQQAAALAADRPPIDRAPADAEEDDDAAWAGRVEAHAAIVADAAERVAELGARRRTDDEARRRHRAATEARVAFDQRAEPFERLDALIGSADGKGLRDFAQSLTLEALLAAANHHLDELAPRYQLERVPARDLELQVIDREMGDEIRSLASLSGGETFLASLALALGLSSLSAGGTTVRTLLVDEGFGTLDPHTLDVALSALDALRATGRQVGIVSHVPGLEERVGATVEVRAVGGGRSVVAVHGAR